MASLAGDGGGGGFTLADVRRWSASKIEGCCSLLAATSRELTAQATEFAEGVATADWTGGAASQAAARRLQLAGSLGRHLAAVNAVERGLQGAIAKVGAVERALAEMDSLAFAREVAVDDVGAITDRLGTQMFPNQQLANEYTAARQAACDEVAASRDRVFELAEQADAALCAALRVADDSDDPAGATRLQGDADPALAEAKAIAGRDVPTGDAKATRDWWTSLPPWLQDSLIADDPKKWGNLNGVPTVARDRANRLSIERDIAVFEARFRAAGRGVPTSVADLDRFINSQAKPPSGADVVSGVGGSSVEQVERQVLEQELAPLKNALRVRDQVARARAEDQPPAFVYAYDAAAFDGRGRAAVAYNNPDTADNVSVCVPGLGSQVSKMDEIGGDARALALASGMADPHHETAVIAWQGYDAPQLDGSDPIGVAHQDKALAGAHLLADDVRALRATRSGGGAITVVGHSYGSTTTGLALQRDDLAKSVDRVVLIGSPGVGGSARNVADLNLRPDQLFVGSAAHDPVSGIINETGRLGSDPATAGFGGRRFRAESTERGSTDFSFADHSRYYDWDERDVPAPHGGKKHITEFSESLYSIGDIVTGRPDDLYDRYLIAQSRDYAVSPAAIGLQPPAPPYRYDPEADRRDVIRYQY